MGVISQVFLSELAIDLPVIIVSLICIYLVLQIYLPKTNTKRKLTTLIIIEIFEHIILPIILLLEMFFTDSWITALLVHITLLSFLFLFLGLVIIKAKTKEDFVRITAVAAFVYFFIFFYPFILIYIQLHSNITGWWIMGVTITFFFGFWLLFRNRKT